MPVVLLQLPKTPTVPQNRPRACPYCTSQVLQRWGRVTKPIKDCGDGLAVIYRYKCCDCQKTFRDYPAGIDRAGHTRAVRQLAGLLSALGLSYRAIAEIFDGFGVDLSHSTVWREGLAITQQLGIQNISKPKNRITIDKTYIHNVSSKFGVVIALDTGDDQYMILGTLNERNPSSVLAWLRPMVQDAGIKTQQLETDVLDFIYHQSLAA
jgi:DNA-directed RNA polymerase subunit RPC12/RpoP